MELHTLKDIRGKRKMKKRIGCGQGSGRGKTSTRGQKGQKSRSGSSIRPGFQGGQIPLYRTLPHRGFSNARYRTEYAIVNLQDLAKLDVTDVNRDVLVEKGLVRSADKLVKILGNGDIDKAVNVTAHHFSKTAKEKIEKAGGKVTVIEIKPAEKEEKSSEKADDAKTK